MDFTGIVHEVLQVGDWGVTPVSLIAPVALIVLILVARRATRPAGPNMDQRDLAGAALITVIIMGAFLWIFAGIGFLNRTFH